MTLALAFLVAACTSSGGTATTAGASPAEEGPTTSAAAATISGFPTTTVEIISPLPPPTGAVIATGAGWELTDEEFAVLVDFAATAMQQSFAAPVTVDVMGPTGVTDLSEGVEYIAPSQWEVLRALRLVGAEDSLQKVNEIRQDRVRGTCCAARDGVITVRVEDTGYEALTSYVIVHELVHALLTMNPPRGVLPDTVFDEPVDVASGASEGVPQWVAVRYHDSLSAGDQQAISADIPIIRSEDLEAGVPEVAAELLTFGYVRGPELVDGLTAAGIERPYDEVVDRFPGTSEQVLFPDAYILDEVPVEPTMPAVPTGFQEAGAGRLGALYLTMLASTQVGEEGALELVRPWAGDTYVLWDEGDRVCLAAEVIMDDTTSGEALAVVLSDWAGAIQSASVEAEGASISIRSCSA